MAKECTICALWFVIILLMVTIKKESAALVFAFLCMCAWECFSHVSEDKGCIKESQKSSHPVSAQISMFGSCSALTQVMTSRSDEKAIYSPSTCQNTRLPLRTFCYFFSPKWNNRTETAKLNFLSWSQYHSIIINKHATLDWFMITICKILQGMMMACTNSLRGGGGLSWWWKVDPIFKEQLQHL